ncbi:MAG TPA: four helix bundle protein [Gemmatimonadales bacterium]|nr:four helix bundle protein [Gemmatimonadales bacterium]
MRPYERFEAWKLAHKLAIGVVKETAGWPKREWYGLAAQVRKASISVPSNIVEGSAKRGPAEFRRYVDIAIGSLAETEYQLRLAKELEFIPEQRWKALDDLVTETGKLLHGLARSLKPPGGK